LGEPRMICKKGKMKGRIEKREKGEK